MNDDFWSYLDRLASECPVTIDRPKGTAHPHYPDMVYPLDYGYLAGSTTVDGGGVDVWVGSLSDRRLDAVVLTVDLTKKDTEIKILLGCTDREKQSILDFLNDFSMRAVLIRRQIDPLDPMISRHSTRRFLPEPVPRQLVEQLLQAAIQAPSAHNCQPWRFVVVRDPEARRRMADGMGPHFRRDLLADGVSPESAEKQVIRSSNRILEAPVLIVLCQDVTIGDDYPDPGRTQTEYLMSAQGVAMAGENILLAAHMLGLGGVWMCGPLFAPEAVRRALALPVSWHPQGMILIGYPASSSAPRSRHPVSEVTMFIE